MLLPYANSLRGEMISIGFGVVLIATGVVLYLRRPLARQALLAAAGVAALELATVLSLAPSDAVDCVDCSAVQLGLSALALAVLPAILVATVAWGLFWAERG